MISWLKRLAVLSVVMSAFVGVAALGALPASAARVPHYTTAHYTIAQASSAALKTVKIVDKSKKAVYSPDKVSGPAVSTCSSTSYSFLVVNNTKANQTVTYEGKPLTGEKPIKPKDGLYICGTAAGTGTFSLKSNKKATLAVTIT
jgi:hypothetical protein